MTLNPSELTEQEGRAWIFLRHFDEVKEIAFPGYFVRRNLDREFVDSFLFRQAVKTIEWLTAELVQVGINTSVWRDYTNFAIIEVGVDIQPAQLRSHPLLKRYLSRTDVQKAPPGRSAEEMEEIYRKIVRPELRPDGVLGTVGLLGIERFE